MGDSVTAVPRRHNAEFDWNGFDPDEYNDHNYRDLLPEDRQILRTASQWLSQTFRGRPRACRAIDVGAGSNLYPSLLMLPWADRLMLSDVSQSNVTWLSENLEPRHPWPWQPFWNEIQHEPGYAEIFRPAELLASRARVQRRSIFDLGRAKWDLGSMFFVADGMTRVWTEFESAVAAFVNCLRPGSPFVSAFMKNSAGYSVGGHGYPAVSVNRDLVQQVFAELDVTQLEVHATDPTERVARPGYDGMLVVTGLTG